MLGICWGYQIHFQAIDEVAANVARTRVREFTEGALKCAQVPKANLEGDRCDAELLMQH
jgi:hypothetical protein